MPQSAASRRTSTVVMTRFDPEAQPWEAASQGLLSLPADLLEPAALRGVLRIPPPPGWVWSQGDGVLLRPLPDEAQFEPVQAAVLIPLVMRGDGLHVMLTRRAGHLRDHPGQISFPGGRMEPFDVDTTATALRETEEETGLGSEFIEVLSTLPAYQTISGYVVTPVVALVRPGFEVRIDPDEVESVFEVPLAFLMDPANHRLHRFTPPDGQARRYYSMPWGEYFIWGATAAMLRNLYRRLSAA
ncbi:CoA pyrophosphatase [Alcaligenaceae bacterium SJ-26]|nr:CoA pyrophosphatase [Alcaligenaceae bacterium SJ-26]